MRVLNSNSHTTHTEPVGWLEIGFLSIWKREAVQLAYILHPKRIWAFMIVLAGLCTAYSWFVRDKNNYTEAITGVFAVFLWLASGISLLIGVKAEDMVFVSSWMMRLFVAFGIIEAVIVIVRIMDIINERKEDRQPTIKSVRL